MRQPAVRASGGLEAATSPQPIATPRALGDGALGVVKPTALDAAVGASAGLVLGRLLAVGNRLEDLLVGVPDAVDSTARGVHEVALAREADGHTPRCGVGG